MRCNPLGPIMIDWKPCWSTEIQVQPKSTKYYLGPSSYMGFIINNVIFIIPEMKLNLTPSHFIHSSFLSVEFIINVCSHTYIYTNTHIHTYTYTCIFFLLLNIYQQTMTLVV